MATPDLLDERVRRCTGTGLRDAQRASTAARLLGEVLARPTWSLYRHVHLVSAFEDARALAPIETVLTVGCGLGLSEQFLAVANPEVRFTLTDVDPKRIELASRSARAHGITNIEVRLLDLLDEPGDDRFDLVTGIEVLEHIEDDRLAAAHARVLASRFVYQLLPGCSERALDDPDARSAGIEVLVAVGELPSSSPERPRWDDRPMPRFPRARLVRGQVERVADAVDRRIVRRR